MSIQNQIDRITNKRDESFVKVQSKGVIVPSGSNMDDLPGLIELIDISPNYVRTGDATLDENDIIVFDSSGEDTFNTQTKSVNPTEASQTVTPDAGYDGLSSVTVGAISSSYVGSNINRRSSSDLTTTGAAVSVPAGYYAEAATKSVGSGSAAVPSTVINVSPSITISSAGLIAVNAAGSSNISPTIVAGYISSGTAGTISVSGSNMEQLTTQNAQTITPSTSSQSVGAAGKYMLGAITVNPIPSNYITTSDATASASGILSGETAYVNGQKITGTLVIQHYYVGSSEPSSSIGEDGDIYLMTEE